MRVTYTEPDLNTNHHHQLQDQNTHSLNSILDINQNETQSTQFLTFSKFPDKLSLEEDSGRLFHYDMFNIRTSDSRSESHDDVVDDNNSGSAANADEEDQIHDKETAGIASDKARHNLATRVMSNGVEVIIAGDKNSKASLKSNALRTVQSLSRKPMTLAPSTLKDQMILVMPSNAQEKYTIPINSKHFITKTCLTTYTYRTTYLQNGKTTIESREKVVSNTATEQRNYLKIKPTETLGITLSRTPELAVGVFHTTYTYYNTILDGEHSIVVSSQHVLTNTITGPDDYISFLQPSEVATPVLETNTYYTKISLTKTFKDSNLEKLVSTSNILTQVIITESMQQPPQASSITASYVAFDSDETTATQYSYFNTDDENVENQKQGKIQSELLRNTIIPSSSTSLSSSSSLLLPSSTAMALELQGSLQTDMHIYATKTFLTTFTYFTTLMNTGNGNGNEGSNIDSSASTVVNFHTRVIENVITESIPSYLINSDLLSTFETQLRNPLNQNNFVTMITLGGGQSLEVTAMNILHPSLHSYDNNKHHPDVKLDTTRTKLESNSLSASENNANIQKPSSSFENSNEILDSEVASSENEELLADQYLAESDPSPIVVRNNTKIVAAPSTTDFASVNQLIGSFDLNRFQALGPVFNAMAGLIQNNLNNFGTNTNSNLELKKNASSLSLEGKQVFKNISTYSNGAGAGNFVGQSHEGPIYIPVQSLPTENSFQSSEKFISPGSGMQGLHISPPVTNSWFNEASFNRVKQQDTSPGPAPGTVSNGKPKYETPLLNGGIAISPGEVITANSDVIVGKPNGIQQPRVPYNNKISDSVVNPLLVPPSPAAQPSIGPYSYQFQHQQIKVSPSPIPLSVSSLKYDQILKPPSIKPHSMQYNNQQQHQHTKNPPPHGFKNANYRAHYATSHMHHPSQHYIQPTQKQQQPRIPFSHLQKNHQIQWPNAQLPKPTMPNYIPYAPFDYDQQYHPPRHPFQNISNNEILEIKRIPEVYSTDLPASAESPTTNSSRSKSPGDGGIYKAFVKKVINPDKPMLVDIQPSKIKNIVFPHDNSASILVVESSVELHKNGQYYDEPTTYPDALMTGSVTITSSSSPNNAANAPARKPILSNQQINLDMNVLSHNVDINAPPITFNKDSEFPLHSTPVRGQIHKTNLFKPFKMPHVTIPITDNQIQVNLTPQNIITQNLSGHFVNDVQTVVNSDSAGVNSENLDLSSYDTYSSVGSSQNQLLSEGEIVIDHQKQLQQQQLQPQTQQQQFEQQKQLLYQHHQQKHNIEGEQQQQFDQLHQQNQQPQTQQKQYFQQQQQKQQVQQRQQQKHQHQQQHEEEELQQQQLPVEYLKPLESSFFFDSSHHTTQNKPNSQSFSHSNNKTYHSYPNVIPIRANIDSSSNSAAKKVFSQNFPTQLISKKTTTTTEDTLQIFAKVKPNIHQQFQPFSNIMVDKQNSQGHNRPPPVSDHMPLVNLFYNSPNEEGSSNKLPNRLLHPTKDDSNRVDDQNPSSSLNIGVLPSASQRDEEEISNSSNDETIFESSQITKIKPSVIYSKSQPPTHPSSTTKTPIPVQPSPSTINHMDDLDTQLPPPSLKNLTTLINLLSSGRPFIPLTSKISTKSPLKNTTIPKLVYHNGEGFKGRPHATDQTQNAILEQPTRPVVDSTKNDAKQQQQYNNILTSPSHQTETPFNPKYTKRTKKPSKTPTAPITLVTDIPSPITTQLDLNQMEVLNQPNDNGNRNISYADVFDYHETVNPNNHNHKFMPTDELEQRTTTIQTLTLADMRTERPIYKNNKDRYQFASEPSTDMKPPKELSIKPQTEKVLGLNPPPPPPPLSAASAPSIPINNLKPTIQPNSFGNFNLNLTERNRSPTVRPALKKLIRTTTSGSIYSKYNSSTTKPRNQKPKPKPNISEKPPNYTTTTTTTTTTKAIAKPTRPQTLIKKPAEFSIATTSLYPFIQKTSTITPSTAKVAAVPSIKEKLEVISQTVKKLPPTSSIEKSAAADSNQESMIFLAQAQEIPEEILIEGSEKPDKHYQTKSLANSFTENLKQTNSPKTNKKTKQSESNQNHPKQQQSTIMLPTLATNSGIKTDFIEFMVPTQARSTSSSSSIIFPTKYITKPHYLTVTTTKLSISTSLGVPVTQTLTLTLTETKTSTLVDTVTETHTLLQPTRVTESHTTTATATATATATQIIHYEDYEDHHHHHHSQQRPAAKIKPTIEVVDNVLLASRESENDSVETLRIPAIPVSTTPTKAFDTAVSKINANLTQDFDNNSIFVVMTDKNSQGGIFSISPSMMDTPQNINAIAGGVNNGSEKVIPAESPNSIELDYDYNITFDYFPTRDEEAEENEVNHVLLGGVLIAAPPRSNNNDDPTSSIVGLTPNATCRPLCKASRNELCQLINNRMQCLCRPGFARMFPDRPCRPTYTYALEIPIHRISKQILHFNEQYRKRDSNEFKELADITHNAVDRMIMQSDLRDVYHGVHVTSFDITNSPETEGGILGKFLIQLSDSSDEKRLVDVFKKYLRLNSFSLGGTETFTTKNGVNSLQVNDFNECAHNQFHDCSENSRCFNLQGTYTCSCQEGFVDLSENSIYPGRICSAEVIGCEKCHFHGKCIQSNKTKQQQPMVVVCECFSWYTGASCQLNLKIVLIALITIGTILFILLLFCVLITCTRRNRDNNNMQSFMSGMQIIAPKNNGSSSAKNLTIDRRAMIKDSSSEGSENSLPYVLKRDVKKQNVSKNTNHHHTQPQNQHHSLKPTKIINQRGHPSSGLLVPSFSETSQHQHQHHNFPEQNDRSLTVMIPRAKYHHSVLAQTSSKTQADGLDLTEYNNEAHLKIVPSDTCGSSSKASTFHCNNDKIFNKNSIKPTTTAIAGVASGGGTINSSHGALLTKNTGALVSAGFEVSATVGSIVNQQQQQQTSSSTTNLSLHDSAAEMNFQKFNYKDTQLQYNNYKDGDKFIDSMDVWIDTIQQNELAAEARSFNETTIQAPTKSLRCTYERQLSQSNGNDEANTMAERDVGSTCLLPHTHLYKPDRDSDVSGFDSF